MSLQILPPEMLEAPQDRIEKAADKPYWKPSSLADGSSEEFRLLGCYDRTLRHWLAICIRMR